MSTRTISATDTAKLIRRTLKHHYPSVKFSVRTDKYAGGASVRIRWTDGPTEQDVRSLVSVFAGKGFDGSIDMGYYRHAWLHADGRVTFAETQGTEGSRGAVPSNYGAPLDETAELVYFAAGYVDTTRDVSDEFVASVAPLVPMHATTLALGEGSGTYYYCRGCGDLLTGDVGMIRHPDGSWVDYAYCGKAECGARVLIRKGIVRPRGVGRVAA